MDLEEKKNELLQLLNPMNLEYTCYYLVRKIEQKNQYHFGFFGDPAYLIVDIYKETKIETEFVKEITPKKHIIQEKEAKKVISFMVWYAKKYNVPIETHQISFKDFPIHFLTLTEDQAENIGLEYDDYIEQLNKLVEAKSAEPAPKLTLF